MCGFSLYCILLSEWTINGKNNTKTNFVVGVTMATVYVAEEKMHILMDVGRRS